MHGADRGKGEEEIVKTANVPEGYHTITPYITLSGVEGLIHFLKQAFDASEREILKTDDGRIIHAEIQIGDSVIMMAEPGTDAGPVYGTFYMYVDNVDSVYQSALAAGASSVMEPADLYYGDRNAAVKDAFGNSWWIAARYEDVSPEELQKRAQSTADS